jgi:hypothetical protein
MSKLQVYSCISWSNYPASHLASQPHATVTKYQNFPDKQIELLFLTVALRVIYPYPPAILPLLQVHEICPSSGMREKALQATCSTPHYHSQDSKKGKGERGKPVKISRQQDTHSHARRAQDPKTSFNAGKVKFQYRACYMPSSSDVKPTHHDRKDRVKTVM